MQMNHAGRGQDGMHMTFDIVAIGEPLYEFNQQPDGRWLGGFGGDTSNVAIAAARLGARAAYISRLGGDVFGQAIADLWQREHVDAGSVAIDATAPTGLYFVTHDAQGHHFTYRRAGSAASLMTPADIPEALIAGAKFLHCSGISQAISASAAAAVRHAIGLAGKHGVGISYDTNFRPRLWSAAEARPEIEYAASRTDILKTSADDCALLFDERDPAAIARRFRTLGSRVVLVTLGSDGVYFESSESAQLIPGHRVASVDATGAGDAFTGALLSELARGTALVAAIRFANAAAALKTLGYGAIAPLPRRADVERFLGEQP